VGCANGGAFWRTFQSVFGESGENMKILKYRVIFGSLCFLLCSDGSVRAQKAPGTPGIPEDLKNEGIASEQEQTEQKQIVSQSLKSPGTPGTEARGAAGMGHDQKASETQTFNWENRPKLNADQERLVLLFKELRTMSQDSVAYNRTQDELDRLTTQLGVDAVRPARPGELLISHGNVVISNGSETEEAIIQNPSDENLVFTVAIKGDEKQIGNRMKSVGHETLLPAKSSLVVRGLYWTTPRTSEINPTRKNR
jgi:hypothetical protein